MNDNAKKWVEALRSGKYRQGSLLLTEKRDGSDFDCCLGIACKVAMANGVEVLTSEVTLTDGRTCVLYDHARSGVPSVVQLWLGLSSSLGEYDGPFEDGGRPALYRVNDAGMPFRKIADIIESEPEGLFKP